MTYIVMETHRSYCVVMDEAGRFIKAANMNYDVGQRVDNILPLETQQKTIISKKTITAIASIAACLILIFNVSWNQIMKPVASIYLTINPNVVMEVNKQDKVVGLSGLNEDGVQLVENYSYRGKTITQVTDELVDRAIEMGFLSDGGKVTIDIDSLDEVWFQNTGITMRGNLEQHVGERMSVTIEIKQYSAESTSDKSSSASPKAPSNSGSEGNSDYTGNAGDSGYSDDDYNDDDDDGGSDYDDN